MLNKTATNDGGDYHHVIIGDMLLHSELKIKVIQVVIQSLSPTPSATFNKPIIHRLSANSPGTNGSPCDLKNTLPVKITPERIKSSSSTKKLMRVHKAGMALVKELKSKVVNSNHTELKALTVDTNNERTHL